MEKPDKDRPERPRALARSYEAVPRRFDLTPQTALGLPAAWRDAIRWTEVGALELDLHLPTHRIEPEHLGDGRRLAHRERLVQELAELPTAELVAAWIGLEAQVRLLHDRPSEQEWVAGGWPVARAEKMLAGGLAAVDEALAMQRSRGGPIPMPPHPEGAAWAGYTSVLGRRPYDREG